MSDFPRNVVVPTHISAFSRAMCGSPIKTSGGAVSAPTSQNWVANSALYMPLYLPWQYNVRRLWWNNGANATANSDIGLYSVGGARLVSAGSTPMAGAGANNLQYVVLPTDLLLLPGQYFLGFSSNGTISAVFGVNVGATILRRAGCLQQTSAAFPLPANAAFAPNATAIIPVVGITNTDSGF